MQPDLLGLEITRGELRRLTGLSPDNVFRPSVLQDSEKRFRFLMNEFLTWLTVSALATGLIYALVVIPFFGSSLEFGLIVLLAVAIIAAFGQWLWRRQKSPPLLARLLAKVDQYHAIIKTIDIHDRHEADAVDRETVIAALQLIREDLVSALRCERMMRQGKTNNLPEFFTHVPELEALQSNQADNNQILHQLLQIAVEVQAEMRKLQLPQAK